MSRDLVGYGGNPPKVEWPGCALAAVSLVVNYEEGAEASLEDGGSRHENDGELSSNVPPTERDLAMEQIFDYGTRAGLWRFLDALDRYERKATFFVCGRAAERTPSLAREVVRRGHEAACHGYRWVSHADMTSADEERTELKRAIDAINKHVGQRPYGFYSRWGPSQWTRGLLSELGFIYDSNAYDDDLPYYDSSGERSMLVIPYALDTNDYKFYSQDPWGTGSAFLDYLRSALEVLLDEGARGKPSMMSVGLHLRILGRPGRFWALEKFLAHLGELGSKVWVARRIDIARHWLERYPPR